jgi:Fe2+ transport system protein FeoA
MEHKQEDVYSPVRSEEEYHPHYEDDTISLVDLIAVVIRHRALIFSGTFVVAVLTAAVLYFGPIVGLEVGPMAEYTVQRRISVDPLPSELRGVVSITPSTELRAMLTDLGVVGSAYRQVEREPDEELSEGRQNVAIRRFAAEKYSVSWSGETETMTVSVTTDDPAYGDDFLEAVIAEAGAAVTVRINTKLEEQRQTLETNLAATRAELERFALQAAERVSRRRWESPRLRCWDNSTSKVGRRSSHSSRWNLRSPLSRRYRETLRLSIGWSRDDPV